MSLLRYRHETKNGTFTERFRPNYFSNPVSHFHHPLDILIVSALGANKSHILRQPEVNTFSFFFTLHQEAILKIFINKHSDHLYMCLFRSSR